ncbi:serine/threonine-protein phosphatase 2A 55 kDa regulatory subunit B alpha-like [Scleropages formosus]|uniref:Serine/threonine-protein phosphatase 2A 55 kDa regulatory subunit B alpha-like n=1 Tax=Scleropages formosus TaxID=113540 RepID=A0A0P7TT21_SCLFO|nr:serine/threonine-protein phosphatase 2A 55 kDa regulatory subunit B alpha-like [Scleropages formosus]
MFKVRLHNERMLLLTLGSLTESCSASVFEDPEDPSNRSFFSEIISSVKFSLNGCYTMTRDYLSVKIWELNVEKQPLETYQVHEYLSSKLCSICKKDCIFDKSGCCWNGNDSMVMMGSYSNFFRMFEHSQRRDVTPEASRESNKQHVALTSRRVCAGGKRKKDEISVDSRGSTRRSCTLYGTHRTTSSPWQPPTTFTVSRKVELGPRSSHPPALHCSLVQSGCHTSFMLCTPCKDEIGGGMECCGH